MYFIYFTVFVLMVFVPIAVPSGMLPFEMDEENLEVMLILFLGTIGFLIYLWEEKKFNINFTKRIQVQKESHQIFKDLGEAYFYIGEVNRKLEIMKSSARAVSENYNKKGVLAYVPFFQSFALLGKSKKMIIRFLDLKTGRMLAEEKTDAKLKIDLGMNNEEIIAKSENFFETENWYVTKSPRDIEGVIGVVAIKKILQSHRIEDPEMMKALVSQALQLFVIAGKKVN